MSEPKRTPGQAEGTEEAIDSTLGEDTHKRRAGQQATDQQAPAEREPGRTPGQAEGTCEQADGSLSKQK